MPKEKREVMLNFKATPSEVQSIQKKMSDAGVKNMSAYLRAMVMNGYMIKLDIPQIREVLRLLSNMTNNLNQIAKRVNAHGSIYETEMEEIKQGQDELWALMNQLLTILERTQL